MIVKLKKWSGILMLAVGIKYYLRDLLFDVNNYDWRRRRNSFATNNNNIKQENTILKLARSRLPEKQKAIYAGRQHC